MLTPGHKDFRAFKEESRQINYTICSMVHRGKTLDEMVAALGLPRKTISGRIHRLRKSGVLPKRKPTSSVDGVDYSLRREGKRIGSFGKFFGFLGREVSDWVIASTPDGLTVSEYVAAVVLDAYNDEMEGAE